MLRLLILTPKILNFKDRISGKYFQQITELTTSKTTEVDILSFLCTNKDQDFKPSVPRGVGVCGPLPKTLTLFMTEICDFPYPIYDLTKNLIPYL